MPEIKIRLFGAFRNLNEPGELTLDIPDGECTVAELKVFLAQRWQNPGEGFDAAALLKKSAMADDERILAETDRLTAGQSVALLPPVSGG